MIKNPKKEQIIKETQNIIQKVGFKEFSINLLGERLNVHRSTILYYFPNKEEILKEALKEYRKGFLQELEEIKKEDISLRQKLEKYINIHKEVLLNGNKICLCAALGSDFPSLPKSIQNQILIHIKENTNFIFNITNNSLQENNLENKSKLFVNSLQGIMMIYRNKNDVEKFYEETNLLIKILYGI